MSIWLRHQRPEYQALLAHIDHGILDMIRVPNLSQLSQDQKERLRLLLDIDAEGVQLHSIELDQPVDFDDDWSLVQQSIRATTDNIEK